MRRASTALGGGWQRPGSRTVAKSKAAHVKVDQGKTLFATRTGRAIWPQLWWLLGHDCCWLATVSEHLGQQGPGYCLRRFLATPLAEILSSQG
jgi:hypothetical protein